MGQILRIEQKEGRQCPVHTKVIYRLGFNRFCDTGMSVSQWLREQLERAVVLSRAGTNPRIISKIVGTVHGQEPKVLGCPAMFKRLLHTFLNIQSDIISGKKPFCNYLSLEPNCYT